MRLKAFTKYLALPVALLLAACGSGAGPVSYGPSPSPSPGAGTVSVRIVDNRQAPVPASGFAYQDGDGAWQALSPGQSTYTFTVSNPRYGFTVRCPDATAHTFQLTTTDGTSWIVECGDAPDTRTATYSVNYDASAVSATRVFLHDSILPWQWSQGPTGTITMQNRRSGPQDLVLEAYNSAGQMFINVRNNVNVPQGSPYNIQVTDADRVTPGGGTVQWSGNVAYAEGASVAYISPLGTWVTVGGAGGRFGTLPNLFGGRYLAAVTTCCQLRGGEEFGGQLYFKLDTATSYSFNLPPWFSGLSVTLNPRPQFSGLSYTGFPNLPVRVYPMILDWTVSEGNVTRSLSWSALVTTGWLGSNTTYTFPDLSGLNGFSGLQPPSTANWRAAAVAVRVESPQSLGWTRSLTSAFASRARARGQQVRRSQQVITIRGVVEGGGAFRLKEGS